MADTKWLVLDNCKISFLQTITAIFPGSAVKRIFFFFMSIVIAQDFLRETGVFLTFEKVDISNGNMESIWKESRTFKVYKLSPLQHVDKFQDIIRT